MSHMSFSNRASAALLLLAAAVGCAGPAQVPTSYTAYNAKDGTFQCDAPDGWEAKGGGGRGPVWAKFTSGSAEIAIRGNLADSLLADAMGGPSADNNALAIELAPVHILHVERMDAAKEEYGGYTELAGYPQELDCRIGPARISEFTAGSTHGYRVTAIAHSRGVTAWCTCRESEWTTLKPVFDRVLGSLERGIAP